MSIGTEMKSRENLRKRESTGDPPHLRSLKPMRWGGRGSQLRLVEIYNQEEGKSKQIKRKIFAIHLNGLYRIIPKNGDPIVIIDMIDSMWRHFTLCKLFKLGNFCHVLRSPTSYIGPAENAEQNYEPGKLHEQCYSEIAGILSRLNLPRRGITNLWKKQSNRASKTRHSIGGCNVGKSRRSAVLWTDPGSACLDSGHWPSQQTDQI